jgi:hypothetical protein
MGGTNAMAPANTMAPSNATGSASH